MGVHVLCRLFCSRAGVHAHPAEVVAEALLHVLPQRQLQRPAGTGERTVYAGGCCTYLAARLSRKALDARRRAADVGMRGLRQHLLGYAIRLPLKYVARLVDPKLCLQPHQLLLAALFAFAGEIRGSRAARALALQHQLAPAAFRLICGGADVAATSGACFATVSACSPARGWAGSSVWPPVRTMSAGAPCS